MTTIFKKVPLTKSETDISFTTLFKRRRLGPRQWKLLLFFIPVFLLFTALTKYFDLVSFTIEFLKVVAFFLLITIVQLLLGFIEIKLGYKKIEQVQLLAKFDLFFFKVVVLRDFFPLILEPQNQEFSMVNKGDFITLEKTGLNRLISWRLT